MNSGRNRSVGDVHRKLRLRFDRTVNRGEFARDKNVDAVWPSSDMSIDPRKFDFQFFRRVAGSAKHAQSARLGNLDDYVPAMAEGEDRSFDVEHL